MTNPYAVGAIVGALIITFLLSRLALMLVRKRLGGVPAIVVAHLATLAFVFVVAGFGFADGGSFRADAVVPYAVCLAGWLLFDILRLRQARTEPANPA